MYQQETTYVKGALVLDTELRRLPRQRRFRPHDRGCTSRSTSPRTSTRAGLKEAIELRGRTQPLAGFSSTRIVGGRRPPALRGLLSLGARAEGVDLTVPPDPGRSSPFENDFRLPVEVEIAAASGAKHPSGRALRLDDDGPTLPAASRPTPRHVRQGRLACLRGDLPAADLGSPGGALRRRPRGGSSVPRASSLRTSRRTPALSTRSRVSSRTRRRTGA